MDGRFHLDRLRSISERRRVPLGLTCFAAVLMLPSLGAGLFQDDLVHRAKLVAHRVLPERYYGTPLLPLDSGTAAGAMRDMFGVTRSPADVVALVDLGLFPWWTSPELRVSNWRPLTALTHWLDYRLFPDAPALMHLHNVFWFGAVVFLVAVFYRRMMSVAWVAALAAFLYVIDESNYFPVRWIANRNLLMALVFSLLALSCHDEWRRRGKVPCAAAAPVFLLLSLLSTEAGIATFAYLFAYALVIDRGGWRRRVLSLVPALLVILGWRIVYNAGGHGASGGGFVIDPGREPVSYLLAVFKRAPFLLAGQWGPLPADTYWMFSEPALAKYLIPVCAFVVLVLAVILPLVRHDRVARFWLVGMLLCVLPICATVPMNRNLLFVALGGFGLVACYVAGVPARADWVPKSRLYRVPIWMVCVLLLLIHVPVALGGRLWSHRMFSISEKVIHSTVAIGESSDMPNRQVVVINAPNPFLFVGLPHARSYEGQALPQTARVLVAGWRPLEITRTGGRTLVVRAKEGNLLSVDESQPDMRPSFLYLWRTFNTLFRSVREPFWVGQQVECPEVTIQVLAVDVDGVPTAVQCDFVTDLKGPSWYWLQWNWKERGLGSYSAFVVPPIGQSVTLAGPL